MVHGKPGLPGISLCERLGKCIHLINDSKGRFEYSMENILAKYDLGIPQDKIKALHELEKLVSETYSTAERDLHIQTVAKTIGVDPKSVKSDVDRLVSRAMTQYKKEAALKVKQDSIGYSDRVNPDFIKAPAVAKNEETLIALLYSYPEHRKKIFDGDLLVEEDFLTELNRRFFVYMRDAYKERDDQHHDLDDRFTAEEVGRLYKMKISRMQLTDNGERVLLDAVNSLKEAVRKKASAKTNTMDELNKLLMQKRQN